MAVPYSSTKLRVPRGFQNLLEGLAREVLREQPQDIYKFGAEFFSNLLKIRDEDGFDPCAEGAKLEDRFYNNRSFKEKDVDPSDPQQQAAALQIQTEYRRHAADQEVQEMREDAAATSIQAAARGAADRQEPGAEDAEEEIDIDLDDPQVAEAATKIQAGFKGYKARREIQEKKKAESGSEPSVQNKSEDLRIDDNDATNAAAARIQAGFRGHQTRKDLSSRKTGASSEPDTEAATSAEEPVDIDLNDPDVVQAATKIQAGYKGMMTRQDLKAKKEAEAASAASQPEQEVTQEPAAQKEDEVDIDLNDPEVAGAATKIQAGFRGMQARKEVASMKQDGDSSVEAAEKPAEQEESAAPSATDSEKEVAATKIQAAARGYQARKEMKDKKDSDGAVAEEPVAGEETAAPADPAADPAAAPAAAEQEEEIDIDLNDPEVANAAEKIQAGFKGYKTRKELKGTKEGAEASEPVAEEAAGDQAGAGDEQAEQPAEQEVKPAEPEAEPTEQAAEPTEQAVESTEQAAEPTEQAAEQ